ncbi:MAG: DUF2267 domain-containing protein [Nitriliruptorales bacterium]
MQYEAFIERVQDRGDFRDRDLAEDATRATLETLGERLTAADAAELAAQLPEDLAGYVERQASGETDPSEFGVKEFCQRVAERQGSDLSPEDAREHVRAVFTTLREAISEGEYTTLLIRLPEGYGELFR